MDTTDRSDLNLPARLPASTLVPAVAREVEVAAVSASINPRQILRGLIRNWWRILLAWVLVSSPLVFLIYKVIEPTYLAEGKLLIETNQPELFGPAPITNESMVAQPVYLMTEVARIMTDRVLIAALAKPGITSLPMFKGSEDRLADLKEKLEVGIIPSTHWVRVALESKDPKEATEIVNAVIDVYTDQNDQHGVGEREKRLKELEAYQSELKKNIDDTKKELQKAAESGNVVFSKPSLKSSEEPDQSPQPNFESLTLDGFKTTKERLMQTKLQLMDLEARLEAKEAELRQAASDGGAIDQNSSENSPELRAEIEQEFKRDSEVADLIDEIRSAKETLAHAKSLGRKSNDPARLAAEKRMDGLNQEYNNLWEIKSVQIRQRLLVPTGARGSELETPAELRRKIQEEKNKEARFEKLIKQNELKIQQSNAETANATFLRDDLERLNKMYDGVNRNHETLKFTRDKPRIFIDDPQPATLAKAPSNNKRIKYMLIVPVAVLFAILGLFFLREVRAERVADPDMLSNRVQSEVYALPPLPSVSAQRKLNGPSDRDQIDRFIQRLDHLRFAVCGDSSHAEIGRCVLVTSAVGGEGKTTLASQLAIRCGNAGISTLLIDADLRRAALCPLLDIPEGLGLSDLLQGQAPLDDNLLTPVQGRIFDLLSAGTPVSDPSRLFQGRAFAMLIAELRQRYEMIIIDSPPVLPVPDALMLGRWTDGALLATKYEMSRAPQVERARRQLDNAGVPVLGTVINCMKSSDAYYGRYSYGRMRDQQNDRARSTRNDEVTQTVEEAAENPTFS